MRRNGEHVPSQTCPTKSRQRLPKTFFFFWSWFFFDFCVCFLFLCAWNRKRARLFPPTLFPVHCQYLLSSTKSKREEETRCMEREREKGTMRLFYFLSSQWFFERGGKIVIFVPLGSLKKKKKRCSFFFFVFFTKKRVPRLPKKNALIRF